MCQNHNFLLIKSDLQHYVILLEMYVSMYTANAERWCRPQSCCQEGLGLLPSQVLYGLYVDFLFVCFMVLTFFPRSKCMC